MKRIPSKLDSFASQINGWLGVERKTLKQTQALLRAEGCVVSLSRLSDWWAAHQKPTPVELRLAEILHRLEQVAERLERGRE